MAFYVLGSMSKDTILRVKNFPSINDEAFCLDQKECHSGGGANVAAYIRTAFGINTYLVSCVGTDHAGESLLKKLNEAGVNTELVQQIEGRPSTRHTILLDRHDNRITYVCSGSMESFSPSILEQAIQEDEGHYLVISPLRPNSALDVFRLLEKSLIKLFWIPGSSLFDLGETFFELLPQVYCLILNKEESLRYSGCEDVFQAARYLMNSGIGLLAITLGHEGSLVFQGDSYLYTPAANVKAVQNVGCGDAFAAGLAGALGQGDSLEEAAKLGNILGAFMATQQYMLDSLPSKEHINIIRDKGMAKSYKYYLSSSLFKKEFSVKK